jgi:predicted transcriptional regulator
VKSIVNLNPGVHLRALQRILGLSFNSTRYHVSRLRSKGEIQSIKDRNRVRLYPPGTESYKLDLHSVLRSRGPRSILSYAISLQGSFTQRQICEKTGFAKSTVSENLNKFVSLGILNKEMSEDTKYRYEVVNRDELKRLLDRTNDSRYEMATTQFIALWDF